MKAFVREGNVEFMEGREPIGRYYPAGLLPFFVEVPQALGERVCAGWRYDGREFTEPEVMSPIPTIGGRYIPNDKEETAQYITRTVEEMERKIIQAENKATEMEQEAIAMGQLATEGELKGLEGTAHEQV